MSNEKNKAAVRRFWDGFNTHSLEVWDSVCTPDFVNHDPSLPSTDADLPLLKESLRPLLAGFPDMTSSEDDLIAEGDMVVVRRTWRGTHQGEFMGVAPTGHDVTFTGIAIARLRGGKIDEHWVSFDALGLLLQIGAIPAPAGRG